ncbi:MAG: aconitate hydratase AcnA [bacterium]|nr:aconitate hydratase AcnA [bacterium]
MDNKKYIHSFELNGKSYQYCDLSSLNIEGYHCDRLPFSIRVLLENVMRKAEDGRDKAAMVKHIALWKGTYDTPIEVPFHPARILMQDFTGVPAVVDLAAMRDAVADAGHSPDSVNPQIPVELIVDHSVQVDRFGSPDALDYNVAKEYQRNRERYSVLKWGRENFSNFSVVPPNSGICHQVNLEYLARVVMVENGGEQTMLFPDTLVGTDSHTPMVNGIGVMGWGVGGIEAEAVLMGQPYYMPLPEVVGVKFKGRLREGITSTDLVLTVTQKLRAQQVVGKFVEYFGPGVKALAVPDRATLANMTPEYGATMGFFPIDEKTMEYLELTDRKEEAAIAEAYARKNNLFYTGETDPQYSQVVEIDLDKVEPCLSGPSRPQDRRSLPDLKTTFLNNLEKDASGAAGKEVPVVMDGTNTAIKNGSIVIAAITSCTNTSNPYAMIGAGLLARNAVKKGLNVPPYVKTSLAPGSKVVMDYLEEAQLVEPLETLGFHAVAFGCTTCIGNSGPLHREIQKAVEQNGLTVAGVLSGNRNFEARIHQKVRANYLASPLLVVAYALAGRVDIDLTTEPLGLDKQGKEVFLQDLMPRDAEVDALVRASVKTAFYKKEYAVIFDGDTNWKELPAFTGTTFQWDEASTYIRKPPFFEDFKMEVDAPVDIEKAKVLLMLGDMVTTDHISPAGEIPGDYPAGQYLKAHKIEPEHFNTYGSRRGNHEVMMRGTFANVRIKNRLAAPKEGGYTVMQDGGERYVFDASGAYQKAGVPLLVLGGKSYGTGSSRDWAAKGTLLLGVKGVLAESFERIHRGNLIGMGVLPMVFKEGESCETFALKGDEEYSISGIAEISPSKELRVKVVRSDGTAVEFTVLCALNTPVEVEYYKHGGILPFVLRKILKG